MGANFLPGKSGIGFSNGLGGDLRNPALPNSSVRSAPQCFSASIANTKWDECDPFARMGKPLVAHYKNMPTLNYTLGEMGKKLGHPNSG